MKTQRWQDWVMLALGAWLFIAPFWMSSYGDASTVASWNSYFFGAALFILSIAALQRPRRWEEWINVVIGAWLVASPFALGFSALTQATWNNIIVGVLVGIDALWAIAPTNTEHATLQHR